MPPMKPEEVPDDLVEKAMKAFPWPWDGLSGVSGDQLETWVRAALAAVLPAHKQSVTAKYRRFVATVRKVTQFGEAMQTPRSQGGNGDECVISPPELRDALRDLRDGRQ